MRRILGRGAVFGWVLVYWFTIHTPIPIMIIPVFGVFWAAISTFIVMILWGLVFNFLLDRDGDVKKVKDLLKELKGEEGGIKSRILRRMPNFEDEPVLPLFWVLMGFVVFGALGGIPILKLTYPEKRASRVFFVILAGCALNIMVWVVLVYGPPFLALRRYILARFSA